MCHFGENDKSPTPDVAKGVMAEHPAEVAFYYAAGHGFNCDHRPSFDADAAKLARGRTLKFLRKYVG
jgi:carboxymethylenebutenolidase